MPDRHESPFAAYLRRVDAPNGARLLLWNGRGGFWAAPVFGKK